MKGQEEERQRRDCEKEEEKEEKRREWESKGEGRGGRRFMNSVAQTRQEKTREGTVKKCNTFHGYCWAGSSPVHTHAHTFLWWWLWLPLHTHFLPVVAHGAYETIK